MKGKERVAAIDASAPRLTRRLPEVPHNVVALMRLMRAANQSLTSFLQMALRQTGFGESALHTLFVIYSSESGTAAPGMLCELVGETKSNMTRILATLIERRLLVRESDDLDGRRQRISMTPDGHQFVQSVIPVISGPLSLSTQGLHVSDLRTLDQLLRRWVSSLDTGEQQLRALL